MEAEMFTEQIWRSEGIEFNLRRMGVLIPKDIADTIACLERDELHRLIELLNLAVWLESYEEWEAFSDEPLFRKANRFLEAQDNKTWLGVLKVLIGLL
jgi:hypothetical protein